MSFTRAGGVLGCLAMAAVAMADDLDAYVRNYMKERHVPAGVWGVFKDGKVVKSRAYGRANLELNVRATSDSVFEIGSVSKQFTATALLMLMEEGRLSLDDRIEKYVGDLPEGWRPVTLRQLLEHTSGIPDMEEIFGYESYRNIYTPAQIVQIANTRPMTFKPGEGFRYSNTGYFLAGLALEKVSGKPYGRFLQERIFGPLGMAHTRESDPTGIIPDRVQGYRFYNGGLEVRDPMQPSACLGAGTLVSNLEDMAKWDAAITGHRLLKPETQAMMFKEARTPQGPTGYGLGWFVSPWRGRTSYEHSGGTAGFSCDYRRFPEAGISAMMFTNLYDAPLGGTLYRAADLVSPGISYASLKPMPEPVAGVREKLLAAMTAVSKGGPRPDAISEKMWATYGPNARDAWRDRLANIKSFELLLRERYKARKNALGEEHIETYLYRLTNEKQVMYIEFQMNPQGQIVLQARRDY
ncbi:class A beta-lactamase-related serine hydrolase [bacterium]|nr:MAG: class A beta-lactamase-related serine hydrolase [bacterium]